MASSKKTPSVDLLARLVSFLEHTIQPGQRLLLGLSGGLDSCVLLDLLVRARSRLSFQLSALHVHHGISPNADAWAKFCLDLCTDRNVPLAVIRVDVPRDCSKGIEAAAREVRYQAFDTQECDAVVLAHHRDDQAETLLLQLMRGSGLKGLSCMAWETQHPPIHMRKHPVYRPLLDVSRFALDCYARENGLQWIDDESNLDLAYDRNFIRHHVLPEMEKRFPAARTTLARSASHFAEASTLLDEIAAEDASIWVSRGRLSIEAFHRLSEVRAKNLLRYWIRTHLPVPPSSRRLHEIYRQLHDAAADSQVCVSLDGGQVRLFRGEAWMVRGASGDFTGFSWSGETSLSFPGGRLNLFHTDGAGMDLALIESKSLHFTPRVEGAVFRPDSKRPTRKLRLLFQEAGIPPWQRDATPMLFIGDRLACVPGVGVAMEFQTQPGMPGLVVEWEPH